MPVLTAHAQGMDASWSAPVSIDTPVTSGIQLQWRKGNNTDDERGKVFLRLRNANAVTIRSEILFEIADTDSGLTKQSRRRFYATPLSYDHPLFFRVPTTSSAGAVKWFTASEWAAEHVEIRAPRLTNLYMAKISAPSGSLYEVYPKNDLLAADPNAKPGIVPDVPVATAPPVETSPHLASDFINLAAPTIRDVNQDTNLIFYGAQGDLVKFVHLYQAGGSINAKQKDGTTALMAAAAKGRLEVVKFIVSRAGAVEATNDIGETALTVAAANDQLDVAQFLLEAGADVNHKNDSGHTALMSAAERQNRDMADLLLHNKARVNDGDNWGNTALMLAAKAGSGPVVHLLIAANADLNKRNVAGKTAFTLASTAGNTAVAGILTTAGGMP